MLNFSHTYFGGGFGAFLLGGLYIAEIAGFFGLFWPEKELRRMRLLFEFGVVVDGGGGGAMLRPLFLIDVLLLSTDGAGLLYILDGDA